MCHMSHNCNGHPGSPLNCKAQKPIPSVVSMAAMARWANAFTGAKKQIVGHVGNKTEKRLQGAIQKEVKHIEPTKQM